MKITDSSIGFQSQHASLSMRSASLQMRAWTGDQRPDFEGRQRPAQAAAGAVAGGAASVSISAAASVRLSLSQAAQNRLSRQTLRSEAPLAASSAGGAGDAESAITPRMRVLMEMVEAITGQKVRVFNARDLQGGGAAVSAPASRSAGAAAAAASAPRAGWGLEVDATERVVETERTQVSAQGVVQTADGQTLQFSLQLEMSRAFASETQVSLRAGDAVMKDPLVINFDGAAAELTDARFAFDLDADGQSEDIAFLGSGSGFLALDKNGDGLVNNGSELFGPAGGDGFADLAQYDLDGNQWIDENDAVYRELQVWQRDASGQDSLSRLADKGVGALYLGRVASPFSLNTPSNQVLGQVRSTGVYVYESGAAGTLQQVDLQV